MDLTQAIADQAVAWTVAFVFVATVVFLANMSE